MRGRGIAPGAIRAGLVAGLAIVGLTAAAPAAAPALAALARIEPGQWQFKTVGSDAPPRAICIADAATLLHFEHRGTACDHVVLANDPAIATVQYRCSGSGNGRTTIRVATPRAFDLETQGIDGGAPYEDHFEAHRLGACAQQSMNRP